LLIIASPGFVTTELLCLPAGKNVSQKVVRKRLDAWWRDRLAGASTCLNMEQFKAPRHGKTGDCRKISGIFPPVWSEDRIILVKIGLERSPAAVCPNRASRHRGTYGKHQTSNRGAAGLRVVALPTPVERSRKARRFLPVVWAGAGGFVTTVISIILLASSAGTTRLAACNHRATARLVCRMKLKQLLLNPTRHRGRHATLRRHLKSPEETIPSSPKRVSSRSESHQLTSPYRERSYGIERSIARRIT
jgi:hypothetical protein